MLPNDPGPRRRIATAPSEIPPAYASALPGPFFQTPQRAPAQRGLGARSRRHPPHPAPSPHPGLRRPSRARPSSPGMGAALPGLRMQAYSHTKIIFFARRREQRKSLTSALVQQLKLGPGMRRGHRRSAPWCLRKLALGVPNLGRGKVCSPLWNSEATSELLNQRERERERSRKKVFRVQINLKALRGRAYLNSEGAIFSEF